MDIKEVIALAKAYVVDVYADEQLTNVGLEELEHFPEQGDWAVTVAFSRPWNTPRTRTQEVLENLGAFSGLKRSYKTLVIRDDGTVVSMKNRERAEFAE